MFRLAAEQGKRSGRSLLEIEKQYFEARERKAKNDSDMHKMDLYLTKVQNGYIARKRKYFKLRKLTKATTQMHFKYFMQRRKHIGELIFDDKGGDQGGTLMDALFNRLRRNLLNLRLNRTDFFPPFCKRAL